MSESSEMVSSASTMSQRCCSRSRHEGGSVSAARRRGGEQHGPDHQGWQGRTGEWRKRVNRTTRAMLGSAGYHKQLPHA
jgi:hypothetical protein